MTDSQQEPERWKLVPDGPDFEVSWDGNFRSRDRLSPSGRNLKGKPIPARISKKTGYPQVDYVNAEGKRVTRELHAVQLEAFAGRCPEGQESRHYDDNPLNNRWRPGTEEESRARGGNLFWGTPEQNRKDRARNTPTAAKPKPARECVRCKGPFEGNGRRCHPCVVDIGKRASEMLARDPDLGKAMKALDYPSAEGLHALAVRYGGYGARKSWWTRTVTPRIATVRSRVTGKPRSRTVSKRTEGPSRSAGGAPEGRKSVGASRTKPGQSGTFESRNVAERDRPEVRVSHPEVTERDRPPVPYPADPVPRDRPPRTRGGISRRSR